MLSRSQNHAINIDMVLLLQIWFNYKVASFGIMCIVAEIAPVPIKTILQMRMGKYNFFFQVSDVQLYCFELFFFSLLAQQLLTVFFGIDCPIM